MARVAPPRRRLLEPTTFLLDQFTAALCLVWGARLLRLAAVGPVRLLWAGMLLATAAAAVAGGIKHGYFSAVDTPLRRVVWLLLTPWTSFTPWVLGATGSAALAGLAQAPAVRLHRHFDHNDFAHVISLISLRLLYRAGLLAGAGGAG